VVQVIFTVWASGIAVDYAVSRAGVATSFGLAGGVSKRAMQTGLLLRFD
jgi:hypothetical protein